MPLQILPVYVSSTWRDLEPERRAVEQAVQRLRETKFVGMEYFGSRDENTRRASLYLRCLIYFKDDSAVPAELREQDPAQAAKLDVLKRELRADALIGKRWLTVTDFNGKPRLYDPDDYVYLVKAIASGA